MPTRKPVLAAVAAIILGLSAAVAADGPDLGRVVTAQEIAAWSLSVGPDGVGLPAGSGTPKQGEAEALLKDPHHAAHRRLGDVELVGGGGEAAMPASRLERA